MSTVQLCSVHVAQQVLLHSFLLSLLSPLIRLKGVNDTVIVSSQVFHKAHELFCGVLGHKNEMLVATLSPPLYTASKMSTHKAYLAVLP